MTHPSTLHDHKKTIVLFGAGSGLGASLAHRFGREGYRVALVARRGEALQQRVVELAEHGIEAKFFVADLGDVANMPTLVAAIEAQLGAIDVAVYAPVPADLSFVPAVSLDAPTLRSLMDLYTYAPIEMARSVVQGQLAKGDGAIVIVGGLSAILAIPGMSGVGPAMAATRNYAHTLNAEVAGQGVYVGTVNIGAFIRGSGSYNAATAGGNTLAGQFPIIEPDLIAQEIWTMVHQRDRVEAVLPPLPRAPQ